MGVILTNEPGADSWPVTSATFILIPRKVPDASRAHEVLKFFDWAWREGSDMARGLDYVPLPEAVTSKIRTVWSAQIRSQDDKPVWP
jgi:phosphate transport system substrate-binding protein